jgi:LTXXQ motif family protein
MPAAGLRLLLLCSAGLIALSLGSGAQARHGWHHGRHWRGFSYEDRVPQERELAPAPAPPRAARPQAGGFAGAVAQIIQACAGQAADLQKTPIDAVLKTVQPSDAQRAALEQIRAAANDAVNTLDASCPKDVPAGLTDRLDTMRASLDAIKAALVPLRPAFVSAYATLNDEQKARLVALSMSQHTAPPSEQGVAAANSAAANEAQPVSLGCRQWPAMLKKWPLDRIESELSLSDDQHAALYTLLAAIYRAAGGVAASCHDENALTPVARLDAELARVEALRQCVDAIAPALAGFANSLNNQQTAQLNAALGLSPQPATTAR